MARCAYASARCRTTCASVSSSTFGTSVAIFFAIACRVLAATCDASDCASSSSAIVVIHPRADSTFATIAARGQRGGSSHVKAIVAAALKGQCASPFPGQVVSVAGDMVAWQALDFLVSTEESFQRARASWRTGAAPRKSPGLPSTPIDDNVGNLIMAQLLHLESEDPEKDIHLYINSPGGDITSLFAIYDTVQYVKPDVSTIVMGQAASAAAVLVLAGTKGKRYALPHSRILLHQPHGGVEGQAVDIEIQAKEIIRYRELLNELIAKHTGQPLEKVTKDTDRDFILTAEQAVEYGAVDEVITSRKILPELAVAATRGA